jgi:hypothetical protein
MLHRNVRPRRGPASLAGRATKQKSHERPALCPQFTHAHEAPFNGPISNQRAILDIHLTEPCPKENSFAGVHLCSFVIHAQGPRTTEAPQDRRTTTIEIRLRFRLPIQAIPRFLDFTEQAGPIDLADRDKLFQDGLSPPVQRRNLLAAREHHLVDDAQWTLERSLRILLGKTTTELCDDHAFPRKRTAQNTRPDSRQKCARTGT